MNIKQIVVPCLLATGILIGGQYSASAAELDPNSVVDHLTSVGIDSSFSNRESLAAKYGIQNYIGSEEQNVQLLSVLQDGSKVVVVPTQQQPVKEAPKPTEAVEVKEVPNTLTMTATAYTAFEGSTEGLTATGTKIANTSRKVVAVDPSVIPLGSRVYVEGYGVATAEDTGGAIKGNRIDLLMESQKEANDFGRQTVQVTILK